MPNIVENNIKVTGNPVDVAKIKALIINDRDDVDFSLSTPMPEPLKGVLADSNYNAFKLNRAIENRLGALTPVEFMTECEKRFKETGNQAFDIKNFDENMATSVYFDRRSSIERIFESHINAYIDKNKIKTISGWHGVYGAFAPKVIAAMNEENKLYCLEHYNMPDCLQWARNNWGVKWGAYDSYNVLNSFNTEQVASDSEFEYYFNTANEHASEWFERLLGLIKDIKDVDIVYTWGDSSCLCGGVLERCDDGELMVCDMSEERVYEFLNIDPDDSDEGNED